MYIEQQTPRNSRSFAMLLAEQQGSVVRATLTLAGRAVTELFPFNRERGLRDMPKLDSKAKHLQCRRDNNALAGPSNADSHNACDSCDGRRFNVVARSDQARYSYRFIRRRRQATSTKACRKARKRHQNSLCRRKLLSRPRPTTEQDRQQR